MPTRPPNPFRYGNPLPPDLFIGRAQVVHYLWNRVYNGESTVLVGGPLQGKTSLLRYFLDERSHPDWLHDGPTRRCFSHINCQLFPSTYRPEQFWQHLIDTLEQDGPAEQLRRHIDRVTQHNYDSLHLSNLFQQLSRLGWALVLLIDEFPLLLQHPNLSNADFFGALRIIASNNDSLHLLIASRLTVAEMNRRSQHQHRLGSPFFNSFAEIHLPPLSAAEVDALIARALPGGEVRFDAADVAFIRQRAGGQPYLVQAAAGSLFDAIASGCAGAERFRVAGEQLRQRLAVYFEMVWHHLTPPCQVILFLWVLRDALGIPEERLHLAQAELRVLSSLGLVERQEEPPGFRLAVGSLADWLTDPAALDLSDWLHQRKSDRLLTEEELERAQRLFYQTPQQGLRPRRVWYCYAPSDQALLQELHNHLAPLREGDLLEGCATPQQADLFLVLLSADFFASQRQQIEWVLQQQQAGAAVVPILARPVEWSQGAWGALQALPRDGRAVTSWPNRDEAWLSVCRAIGELARSGAP